MFAQFVQFFFSISYCDKMKKRVCDSASDLSSFPTVYDAMLPRSVKIEKLKMKKSIERDLGPSLLAARG